MDITDKIVRMPDETEDEYCRRWYVLKDNLGLTWMELAEIINEELGYTYGPDRYRKDSRKFEKTHCEKNYSSQSISEEGAPNEGLNEVRKERIKLQDERTQINALYRRIAREDSIKEIAHDFANIMSSKKVLPKYVPIVKHNKNEAILLISDWHYGIEIDSLWNRYNPDIAVQRITKLRDGVINYLRKEDITTIHIVNLGDLIAGRIHLQLRMNSRFDVITQTMEVSELLAEFINDISACAKVNYYDTLDNHSRLEPNLKESLDLESLTRITTWFLKERLKDNDFVTIYDNVIADDIISFETLGHKVIGVHGDRDKPDKVIDNLSMMTKQHYDLVVTAHLHHFSCEEKNETVLISNSSMMGTDDYAEKLRLCAAPSQCLIIVSPENVCASIHKINLD